MNRYAQILYNKAHWIFEAEEKPEFAPDIILIDITDNKKVQEGWDYNSKTGKFTEPVYEEVIIELTEVEALTDYVLEVDMRLIMVEMGL